MKVKTIAQYDVGLYRVTIQTTKFKMFKYYVDITYKKKFINYSWAHGLDEAKKQAHKMILSHRKEKSFGGVF